MEEHVLIAFYPFTFLPPMQIILYMELYVSASSFLMFFLVSVFYLFHNFRLSCFFILE